MCAKMAEKSKNRLQTLLIVALGWRTSRHGANFDKQLRNAAAVVRPDTQHKGMETELTRMRGRWSAGVMGGDAAGRIAPFLAAPKSRETRTSKQVSNRLTRALRQAGPGG